jgi:tetratricopeptide (TPR) repeat protein
VRRASLLALCIASAAAAAPKDGSKLVEKVLGELDAWDVSGAVAALDELQQVDPDGAAAAYLRGRVLFEQGKYEESVAAYDEASARSEKSDGALASEVRGALRHDRQLAKLTAAEVKGDDVHESAHFVLRTHKGKDALLAPYALAGLEKAYEALTKDLGFQPTEKVRVEVYESAQALARVSPLTVAEIKASGTIALCKYNRLMITTPRALLRGYPWVDTLSHELVHFLVTKKGRGNVPIWLQEGLAKFLETRWRGEPGLAVDQASVALLHKAARANSLIPFAKMHPSIAKLPTQELAALAFAEVEAAIKLLYDRGGQQALTELVSAMAHGFSDEKAVAQAYGKSFALFEADWRKDVARPRNGAATNGARAKQSKKLVFKEDAKSKAAAAARPEGDSADPASMTDADAKKAYQLGEILLARRRWGAAAIEYGRARAKVKDTVPALSRRYALACLQLHKLDEALAALIGATTTDPQDEAAQALLARVYLQRKDFDKAGAALEAGNAVDPFDPELHATWLEVAAGKGDAELRKRERNAFSLAARGVPDGAAAIESTEKTEKASHPREDKHP